MKQYKDDIRTVYAESNYVRVEYAKGVGEQYEIEALADEQIHLKGFGFAYPPMSEAELRVLATLARELGIQPFDLTEDKE